VGPEKAQILPLEKLPVHAGGVLGCSLPVGALDDPVIHHIRWTITPQLELRTERQGFSARGNLAVTRSVFTIIKPRYNSGRCTPFTQHSARCPSVGLHSPDDNSRGKAALTILPILMSGGDRVLLD
jgi:hypothetical protein